MAVKRKFITQISFHMLDICVICEMYAWLRVPLEHFEKDTFYHMFYIQTYTK